MFFFPYNNDMLNNWFDEMDSVCLKPWEICDNCKFYSFFNDRCENEKSGRTVNVKGMNKCKEFIKND